MSNENSKTVFIIVFLIIASNLATIFIRDQYFKPLDEEKIMLEVRDQANHIQATMFSLDELRSTQIKKLDSLRRMEEDSKRIELWRRIIDMVNNHKTATELPPFVSKPTRIPSSVIPVKNRMYHTPKSILLTKVMS